ncbi:hypothetical protein GKC29_28725 [Micromonospora sp. WMMC415]|uniref:hypothetical protein n=1 Tax=Micromonospora sp. WMMC415 TaxID=2675222 RepID=UPI0012B4C01D|nr:hypothetical protein [Micromonospora sp. WMMC415]QGN50412.1 hypothetical protein GKC29_28725 [Micromonospora sp. WMMC415]
MQPEGPYRFTHALGGSPVGKAWAAIDDQGRFVTVAVLDAAAAAAPGWREAFAGIANSLAQAPDPLPYTYADFAADSPWVAYPADAGPGAERLFRALGVEYTPVPTVVPPTSAPPVSAPPVSAPPVSGPPQPVSGAPEPVSGMPQTPWAVQATPIPGQPVSASPHPISGAPASPAAPDASTHGHVHPSGAYASPTAVPPRDPFASPVRRITPSAPRRRRTGLWVGIAALVLVVLAGAGGIFVWTGSEGSDQPENVGAGANAVPPPVPTSPPQSPGIEPPQAGSWPKGWPKFTPQDNVRTLSDLDGLGFTVKVPADWQCTPAGRAEGFVKYNCGVSESGKPQIGGELIVRDCPLPCNEERQATMRRSEDAWGLQWMRGSQFSSYAESSRLELDGERRYGLVVVAYWRGGDSGRVDRQLVLRMTSPIDGAGRLRRVGNHLRDTLIF